MAHNDDAERVLAECAECGSAYAARRWPDGTVRAIGRDGCSCGATEFAVVEESEDADSPTPGDAE